MDSGNSGSIQSSSGGDDEFDSRADSITAAFLTNPPTHGGSFPGNFHPAHSSAAMFDPLSNLFDQRSSSSLSNHNPLLNFDMVWSRTGRSDQIPTDLAGPPPNSASADQSLSSISNFSGDQNFSQPSDGGTNNSFRPSDQIELQNNPNNCGGGGGGGGASVARNNVKKRPRASRRAPTTVLTTDTTNFRAMVQEFTGIPAPPFTASSSSPFTRTAARFDLFGGAGGGGKSTAHFDTLPSSQTYLLRPFPQKPQFLSPSPSTFLTGGGNLQNPIFDIHSMFQSNPKLIPNSSTDQNLKMGIFEEFGLSSLGHGLPPAGQTMPSSTRDNHNNPLTPTSWIVGGGGGGGESNHQGLNLRSSNGNSNGKWIRYAAGGNVNSSEFLGEKAAENLRARTEGMMEPWICSSD